MHLGRIFLGNSLNNIPINLYILNQSELQKFFKSYTGVYAFFLPNIILKHGKAIKIKDTHFTQTLNKIFSDKSLTTLDIIASVEFIENFGFPTEYINKAFVEQSCTSDMITKTINQLKCSVELIEM